MSCLKAERRPSTRTQSLSPPQNQTESAGASSGTKEMKAAKLLMPRCTSKPQELLHTEHSRASRTDSLVCTA